MIIEFINQGFKKTKLIQLPILVLLLFISCRKENLSCSGNCIEVKFAGRVFNKATNTPLNNQVVSVAFNKNGFCLICLPNKKIGSVKTERDGSFSLLTTIDSTWMKENHFTVSVKTPEGYLMYPEPVGPGIVNKPLYSSIDFYELDPGKMGNMSFEFYPKVLLKINLHRTTPISPDKSLGLEFTIKDRASIWGLVESGSNADTSITINTSASLYTKIVARKFITADSVSTKIDSVYCKPNESNAITILY